MMNDAMLGELDKKIRLLKKTAMEIRDLAGDFPAVERNSSRILASIKMMEINVTDLADSGIAVTPK